MTRKGRPRHRPVTLKRHSWDKPPEPEVLEDSDPRVEPDWTKTCEVCGGSPVVPLTGLCGPCTFGEAETIGGNW